MSFEASKPKDLNRKDKIGGRRGRDRMVVRFTTTRAINAYHH